MYKSRLLHFIKDLRIFPSVFPVSLFLRILHNLPRFFPVSPFETRCKASCALRLRHPWLRRVPKGLPENNRCLYRVFQRLCSSLFFVALLLVPALSQADKLADDYVKAADRYRQSDQAMRIESEIELYKNGSLSKKKHYRIFVRQGRKSLVLMMSPAEKGQKILMLDDKFWILMPKSRRPIRITPMQKLLGEASTGDIATLNWHEDFAAEFIDRAQAEQDVLMLTAKRKGTTYHRIKLWLQKNTHKPIRAELYVKSGKLAKVARFRYQKEQGTERVTSMILEDHIKKNRKTIIHYRTMQPYELAKKYFNPVFLIKNPKIKP